MSIRKEAIILAQEIKKLADDFYIKNGASFSVDINWVDVTSYSDGDVMLSPVVTVSVEVGDVQA
jgi:hypothetical protein